MTPDEVEQRQALDGTMDDPDGVGDASDEPLTPDQIEQRQRLDGSVEAAGAGDEVSDEPLTADQIEQRRVVADDDADDHRPD